MLSIEESKELNDGLSSLDQVACALEALCSFEYRIERSNEQQRHLMLMKQTNSKSFLLTQDIRQSSTALDFKSRAYKIAEKALSFFVSK